MSLHDLKNHIARLTKLRDAYHDQLDASALAELNDVLCQLKKLEESGTSNVRLGALATRMLLIIDAVLRLVTNISDLIQ